MIVVWSVSVNPHSLVAHSRGISILAQNEHIRSVEDTKLTSKKRNGVASFIKYFPTYVGRVEAQLIGSDSLEIRQIVDASYDRIVEAMFAALKQMAKMDGEGEDKGQLNYHVILIGKGRRIAFHNCLHCS